MSKIKKAPPLRPSKTKKQVIVVPTAQQVTKTKSTKSLPARSQSSKPNTLAYYNCLIDQIANPGNAKVKITALAHHCKCNKGQVAQVQQEHKKKLVQQLAKNYKAFGESLGHYLQADIVGCLQDKK